MIQFGLVNVQKPNCKKIRSERMRGETFAFPLTSLAQTAGWWQIGLVPILFHENMKLEVRAQTEEGGLGLVTNCSCARSCFLRIVGSPGEALLTFFFWQRHFLSRVHLHSFIFFLFKVIWSFCQLWCSVLMSLLDHF